MQASTSLMVPEKELSRVAGMNQTLNGVLNIAAPPLGALVVGLFPMGPIMMIDVVTAFLAILPLFFVHIPQPKNVAQTQISVGQVWRDVREGFAYVWAWPGLVIILLMATMINFLLNPTGTLMPLLVTRHFCGGAWHLSALESAFGIGTIAGGLLLSVWGGFKKRILTMMIFLMVMGGAQLLTGGAPSGFFWLAIVGGVLGGITGPMVNGPLVCHDAVAHQARDAGARLYPDRQPGGGHVAARPGGWPPRWPTTWASRCGGGSAGSPASCWRWRASLSRR